MATRGVSRKAGRVEGTSGTNGRVFIRRALGLAGERTVHGYGIRGACGNKTIPRALRRIIAQATLSGPVGCATYEIRSPRRALWAGVGWIETGGPGARRQQCHVAANGVWVGGFGRPPVAAPESARNQQDRKRARRVRHQRSHSLPPFGSGATSARTHPTTSAWAFTGETMFFAVVGQS